MYCSQCGKQIKENVKYCPYCGAETIEKTKKHDASANKAISVKRIILPLIILLALIMVLCIIIPKLMYKTYYDIWGDKMTWVNVSYTGSEGETGFYEYEFDDQDRLVRQYNYETDDESRIACYIWYEWSYSDTEGLLEQMTAYGTDGSVEFIYQYEYATITNPHAPRWHHCA